MPRIDVTNVDNLLCQEMDELNEWDGRETCCAVVMIFLRNKDDKQKGC